MPQTFILPHEYTAFVAAYTALVAVLMTALIVTLTATVTVATSTVPVTSTTAATVTAIITSAAVTFTAVTATAMATILADVRANQKRSTAKQQVRVFLFQVPRQNSFSTVPLPGTSDFPFSFN